MVAVATAPAPPPPPKNVPPDVRWKAAPPYSVPPLPTVTLFTVPVEELVIVAPLLIDQTYDAAGRRAMEATLPAELPAAARAVIAAGAAQTWTSSAVVAL